MADETPATIELSVTTPEQLFNHLDPFPFRERDLDKSAEEFIVGWARELPAASPIRIVVHIPQANLGSWQVSDIEQAFRSYFAYRAEMTGRDLSELFRTGRRSLQIGLTVLLLSVAASQLSIARFGHDGLVAVLNEGLIILGWVANWRPLEIFLYDWWPIVGKRRLYRRLSVASVELAVQG
jgi:hypothetical protein